MAFDTVNTGIFLDWLRILGIDGTMLCWFSPFSGINCNQWWCGGGDPTVSPYCMLSPIQHLHEAMKWIHPTQLIHPWWIKQCHGCLILVLAGCENLDGENRLQLNSCKTELFWIWWSAGYRNKRYRISLPCPKQSWCIIWRFYHGEAVARI